MFQGHWSPIVRQMRGSSKPDGMCLVVGSCASGFPPEQNRCPAFPLLEYALRDMQCYLSGIKCQNHLNIVQNVALLLLKQTAAFAEVQTSCGR